MGELTPYWQSDDGRYVLYCGDVLDVLSRLPDETFQMCLTSPPYWALRSYLDDDDPLKGMEYGLEETPEQYVERLVGVFEEVRRTLRADGVVFLNLGDSYAGSGKGRNRDGTHQEGGKQGTSRGTIDGLLYKTETSGGLKPKDLVGIPWRTAFALQAVGWWLRSEIIWAKGVSGQKTVEEAVYQALVAADIQSEQIDAVMEQLDVYVGNPMIESCRDRPTRAHEHIFLLAKSRRYYYDTAYMQEPAKYPDDKRKPYAPGQVDKRGNGHDRGGGSIRKNAIPYRNNRDVWQIPTKGYKGAHFATFPITLITAPILAGSAARSCVGCGAPWARVVQRGNSEHHCRPGCGCKEKEGQMQNWSEGYRGYGGFSNTAVFTEDFTPSCRCGVDEHEPSTVLDPFAGSGTTGVVAYNCGRKFVGIELNREYCDLAVERFKAECGGS